MEENIRKGKKITSKRSLQAKNVAIKVSENIRKGKKINLGKIIKEEGYSNSVSKHPDRVTDTKSYQEIINPVIQSMIRERDRAIEEMAKRVNEASYSDFVTAVDKLTKNIQLLSGKETSKGAITFGWEE